MALPHLVFQDTDDVNFYGLKDVLMTSGGHTTMLANGFDFQSFCLYLTVIFTKISLQKINYDANKTSRQPMGYWKIINVTLGQTQH